jgi:hypothetical protein
MERNRREKLILGSVTEAEFCALTFQKKKKKKE